jgi:hypothetical protein
MSEKITYTERDLLYFRQWLCLDMKSVTWQGKYTEDFEKFWATFFLPGISLSEMSNRFRYAFDRAQVGPISSWFLWLRDKFIAYTFIEKSISIKLLCEELDLPVSIVARVLRNFFVDVFPHHEDYFNEKLLITGPTSPHLHLTAKQLVDDIEEEINFSGSHDEEIMTSMEVTLYDDWSTFLEKMHRDFVGKTLDLDKVKNKDAFKKNMQTLGNVVAVLGVSLFLVWAVEFANKKYETYLSEKISIYEPQFRWEDKGLKFTDNTQQAQLAENFELDVEDIENVDDSESILGESLEDVERVGVESEVVLTSLDTLPKDFDVADSETSKFEEEVKRGYRDSRYGNTKVYRVMMRSSDTRNARQQLSDLLDRYNVTQVDNVKPGLAVPGGFYYNLYVPRTYLKEFMAQVQDVDKAIIYESRTRTRRNPPGKNKVFIWVKSI